MWSADADSGLNPLGAGVVGAARPTVVAHAVFGYLAGGSLGLFRAKYSDSVQA